MSSKKLILLLLVCLSHWTFAQSKTDEIIEKIVETLAENPGEDYDYSELADRLNYYSKNPININKSNEEELKELIFLNPLQIRAIIQYPEKNGPFIDLLELQSINGLDLEVINLLLPFITVNQSNLLTGMSFNDVLKKGHHDLMIRYGQVLERQLGFLAGDTSNHQHYLGTPQRLFVRYRYNYGQHIFVSLNMEKDAGEGFFSGAQSAGFDFYSANLFFRNTGKFKKIVIGDYALQFGQGLTLWTGLGFGKGASIAGVTKPEIGLRPYSSANEALFFRGLATTLNFKRVSLTPFISYRSLDGGLDPAMSPADAGLRSLNQTGFHRTVTEIGNKNSLKQLVYGLNIQYSSRNFNAGAIGYQTSFDHAFEAGQSEYKKFEFSGRSLFNTGVYFSRNWRNMYFFGEAAHSIHSGFSYLNGLLVSLSPQISIVLVQRNYQKDYQSLYSGPIAEGSNGANEKGFYSGLNLVPAPRFELAMYADLFRFPWLKYRIDAPSEGFEIYSQLSYTIKDKLKAVLRYSKEEKEQNAETDNALDILETVRKQNYRLSMEYMIGRNIQIRNRAEVAEYKKGDQATEYGIMLFQDIIYNPLQSRFSGNLRFGIFDTGGYNSRIYAYENDVLFGYSMPAIQGRGLRFYANGRYTLKRGIDLWLKYAVTEITNTDEIGSGLDLIKGSTRSDVKVQLRFQF